MPIFEFKCKKCNKITEVWTQFKETKIRCKCGGKLESQFPSKCSFQLKGTCWSSDGYNKSTD